MAGATARVVDLSNVKEGGNFNKSRIASGDYLAKIVKVEDAVAKDKVDQYLFTIQIVEHSATRLPYYCKLQENQLWKLRNIFIAAGKVVPKKRLKVDPNQIVGKLIGVTVEDAEYEGKEQSEIAGVFPSAELGDTSAVTSSDDEDEPTEDEDDDGSDLGGDDESADDAEEAEEEPDEAEEEPEEEADPYEALTREELKTRIKAQQPDFKVFKSTTDEALREALRLLETTSDQEEDDSPEPAPVRKKRAPKTSTENLSDDDLDDLDIDSI